MELIREKAREAKNFIFTFLKWVICALVVGLVCGGVGILFHLAIAAATGFRVHHDFIVYLLPVGGILTVCCYRLCRIDTSVGTDQVISSIRSQEKIPILMAPLIFVSTVTAQFFGSSTGREGAALQIGGSIGSTFGRLCRLDSNDIRIMTLCGMSSVFAAVFGTPLTATVFAIEVISIGVLHYSALIPCIVSSVTAYTLAEMAGIEAVRFSLTVPPFSVVLAVQTMGLAALCAILSIGYCIVMKQTRYLATQYIQNEFLRILFGSGVALLLMVLLNTRAFNGAGLEQITVAIAGKSAPLDFFWKILLTAICIAAGFKGGEIVPTMMIGAAFGCTVGPLLGMPASFAAAMGLVCLFCSVVNCPMSSIILSVELFGTGNILLFAMACCVSYMLSGYYGLYSSQKIVYSKLKTEFIDRAIH